MGAPNGKESNLDERQYDEVRTRNFKKWFGDWEKSRLLSQVDLPKKEDSGLVRGINLLKGIKGIETIFFTNEDIVRHPLVTKIVKAFDRQESE